MVTRRQVCLLLAVAPAACGSPPRLYTLAAIPGNRRAGAPHVVELRKIELACYMERSQIVRSSDGFRVSVLDNEQWGEPLDAILARILVQELTQRLPDSMIFAENSIVAAPVDSTVGINILSMDADHGGTLILQAQIAITGPKAAMRSVHFTVAPLLPDTPGLMSAMSTAIGQLADTVAEMLTMSIAAPTPVQNEVRRLRRRLKRVQGQRNAAREQRNVLKKIIETLPDAPK